MVEVDIGRDIYRSTFEDVLEESAERLGYSYIPGDKQYNLNNGTIFESENEYLDRDVDGPIIRTTSIITYGIFDPLLSVIRISFEDVCNVNNFKISRTLFGYMSSVNFDAYFKTVKENIANTL